MKRRTGSGRSIISGVQRKTSDDLPDYVAERAARDQGYPAVVATEVERQALRHRLAGSVGRLGAARRSGGNLAGGRASGGCPTGEDDVQDDPQRRTVGDHRC